MERDIRDSENVASLSLSSHGRMRLDLFQGHAGPSAGPREPSVYDNGGAHDLSRA
jgi:hypothetical protein